MKIVCVGAGYVGSVTAASFASLGHHTTVIDMDLAKVESIMAGRSPIYEPGLDELIQTTVGKSLFADTVYDAVRNADIVMICVGTPSKPDGTVDLKYVKQAAASIAKHLDPQRFTVIVTKSTVPVGTADSLTSLIEEVSGMSAGKQFALASNPEFLREGYALEDVSHPDRIIVGSDDPQALALMKRLYQPSPKSKTVYFESDAKSAELVKYASNAFLAVKISYINEMARLCEALGVNVKDVATGMGLDSRIGSAFLQVSSGWSGSCFPKDTKELLATSLKYDRELSIVRAAIESNTAMHRFCLEKIRSRLRSLNGKTVGILGLTFKPDTDDARQTQASYFIQELTSLGATVRVHDPKGMEMFESCHPEIPVTFCKTAEEAGYRADCLVLLTHWKEYLDLDWVTIYDHMRKPYILDTRNFLPRERLAELGFHYEGIGVL